SFLVWKCANARSSLRVDSPTLEASKVFFLLDF
ncbi:hypothetical protein MPH_14126, partial [Macrophomina phaseolina MS6]